MSFGNGYNGGRTRMGTKVFLNVYDLSPANEYLYPIGMGLHHSGLEIDGKEYSYGSGGGIFDGPPKIAPGARFRTQLELGAFDGGSQELNKALDDLRHNGGFGPDGYNLVRRNCNHFCNALSWKLLRKPIPPYINRLANIGDCCSCLLPKQLLEDSPVGGNGNNQSPSFAVPTLTSMNRGGPGAKTSTTTAFAGKGECLGGSSSTSKSEATGLLSRWSSTQASSSSSGTAVDELTDRRERARKAALARLERNQQQPSSTGNKES
ncbi:PPPDE putative peptidase domain containing protein [Nitzschia inconspicua]|uniref:PPPDE putative peptidase domain containing protein n=1 Tax=Nitzschia inconspicua TaxID=303405 RepID=A0A9K3PXL0_9STRA|nr:PPPDE putative peptidase domain containing protein [Nitzschia inconspicua]